MIKDKSILFFDGICGLCNKSVDFLMSIDKRNHLLFAPLQGETAADILESKHIKDLDSMALYLNGKTYTKSTAVLKSIVEIGGLWSVLGVFLIVPPFIRDFVYGIVASNRYKIFGKNDTCRLPTLEERYKILL